MTQDNGAKAGVRPGVTFVVPCFNHGRFVREAVASCLAQVDADVRVVVVNDGSTDPATPPACDACAGERVIVIHQPNAGLPAARNAGALAARAHPTEFIAFLDADDTIDPRFVSVLARAIADEKGGPPVSHAYCQEVLTELGTGTWRVPEWDPELLLITNLHPVTCLVRRDAFEAVGGFDATMRDGYEDWELWVRLSARGYRGVRVREPLFFWRRHSATTMIIEAIARHDQLYGQIVDRHADHYRARADGIIRRANSLLRRFDCNWIDETGNPIPLQWLWSQRDEAARLRADVAALTAARDHAVAAATAQVRATEEHAARAHTELVATRAWYEQLLAVRVYRGAERLMAFLPGPVARGVRRVLGSAKRLLPVGTGRPRNAG